MPNPPLPLPATPIQAAWGQAVTTRVVNVYQNAAARDAAIPTPEDGQLAYLIDEDLLTVRIAGVLWVTMGVGTFVQVSGDTMDGDLSMGSHSLTGLPTPSAATDAVPRDWANDNYTGKFIAITRGVALPAMTAAHAAWADYGPDFNMGTPSGEYAWVTASASSDVLSSAGISIYQMRIGISANAGVNWDYGPSIWGTADATSRRQAITAAHFLDTGALNDAVRIKAQVLQSSGGDARFSDGTMIATMAKTSGKT